MSSLMASRPAIAMRSKLRQHPMAQGFVLGLLKMTSPVQEYEKNFRRAMFECIRPGDCVWDVGANVGVYSQLFAEAVGTTGTVVSVEPAPDCLATLQARRQSVAGSATWQIVAGALSNKDGHAWLSITGGGTAPGNHMADGPAIDTTQVEQFRAESVVATGYPSPSVMKIDVEGFEGEVLDGMGALMARTTLRAICMEVHFGALARRGKPAEPARMVRLLDDYKFAINWTDRSHLVARRKVG